MKKPAVTLILVCIAAMAFAAGNQQTTGGSNQWPPTAAPNSPITISVFHETGGHPQPAANNPIYSYLKEKLNVSFEWDILVGDRNQRVGTMIAGKQYPDLLELRGNEWIEAGALIPLEGLIEQYGPRIKALYKDVWDKMKSEDGHIYYLINYGVFQGIDHSPNYDQAAFWIQKEVLRDAGFPKVVTVDQYFDLIQNYLRRNPTINGQPTIPFTVLTFDWRAFELWNPPNFLAGNANEGNGVVDARNNYKYTNFFTMDFSKRWFQKLNQLNAQGLIDRTSFTDNYDQYTAKIAAGRVLGTSVQGWQIGTANNTARDRISNWRSMVPLPVVFDANTKPHYRNVTIPNLLRGVGISVSAKDPIRIIRYFNDLLAEDVQRTIHWGIEGQHWQYNAQKIPYRTEEQRNNWRNQQWQEANRGLLLGDVTPKIQGSFSDGFPADLTLYFPEREADLRPEDKQLYAAYGVTGTNELMDKNPPPNDPWFPTWSMPTPPDGSPADIAIKRCEQTMKQRLPQIILAPPADFERLWTAYVNEMNSNGLAAYEAYMQEQLNIRLRQWNIRR
jgi:putative aldouronate transport system substrate-binding protein